MALVHTVTARNDATESENRIHADAVAKQHGFRGGLVPGVVTWGHLADAVVTALGPAWLQDGTMSARFVAPVYDGDEPAVPGGVARERERNGRRFVDLDLLYVVDETRPVWHVDHTAIYDLGEGAGTATAS